MNITQQVLMRSLGSRGQQMKVGHEKLATERWLEDHQLAKLCRACRKSKRRKRGDR